MKVIILPINGKEITAAVIAHLVGQEIEVMTEEDMGVWAGDNEDRNGLLACVDWDTYSYVAPISDSDCYSFRKEWVNPIIKFTTIEEGFEILREYYSGSEVVAEEMIDFMFSNDSFDSSIPTSVLHGAIQMFRSWDCEDDEVNSDGVNFSFPNGSIVPMGMRVGVADTEGIHIDENITVKGVVEEFKVYATMTTTLCVNVYAVSQSSAMGIAKEIDGGEFVEVEELGEWNVYDAVSVEG